MTVKRTLRLRVGVIDIAWYVPRWRIDGIAKDVEYEKRVVEIESL